MNTVPAQVIEAMQGDVECRAATAKYVEKVAAFLEPIGHKAPLVADQLIKSGFADPGTRDSLIKRLRDPGQTLDILAHVARTAPREVPALGGPVKTAAQTQRSTRSAADEAFAAIVNG